jgi:hypothetical protein
MQRLLGSLVLLAALAPAAWAQEEIRITEADLNQRASWGDKLGKDVVLENVKFDGYSYPYIHIGGAQNRTTKLQINTSNKALADGLPLWRTPAGADLDRKHHLSNVKITGVARDTNDGDRYVEVRDVVKLPDDVEQFASEAKKLSKPDDILKLADRARKRADLFNDADLRAWTLKANESALKMQQDALPKNESYAKAAIDLALRFKSLANAPVLGISLLNSVWGDPNTTAADKDATARVLTVDLEASQFHGSWVPRDEFKKALGFVAQKDAQGATVWLRRERVELNVEVTKEKPVIRDDPNPRKVSAFLYEQSAAKGELAVGMYKAEVVRAKGYGFPDFVDRIEEKMPGGTVTWDQWILNGGDRLYFVNGLLYTWKTKNDAWELGDAK